MMSRVGSALYFYLFLVLCTASLDLSQIQVYPENGGISEVFIVWLKNQPYRFNATTAVDVCISLGFRIASQTQVETARSNGLQTCRYGWVMEKIAVIPRIEKNEKCGKNKVGIIVWATPSSQLFDVFCSSSTGQTKATTSTTPVTTMVFDKRTDAKTTWSSFILTTQLNKYFLHSSPSPQPISTGFNMSVIPKIFSSTFAPVTTNSSQTFPPSSFLPSAGYQSPISSSFSILSSSTDLSSQPFINSSFVTISSNETDGQPPAGKGAVTMACVIPVVMLLMVAGTGAVWYFKIKRPHCLTPWERICHKDMFETEMWKRHHLHLYNDSGNCGDDITLQLEDGTRTDIFGMDLDELKWDMDGEGKL